RRAECFDAPRVLLESAVREVQPRDVQAHPNHPLQYVGRVGGWPDGGDDFGFVRRERHLWSSGATKNCFGILERMNANQVSSATSRRAEAHSSTSRYPTASKVGPMNTPMKPNASAPPSTPKKIKMNGMSLPWLMSHGLTTL